MYYGKRQSTINSPENTPLASNTLTHHPCYIRKQLWESSFMSIFSCNSAKTDSLEKGVSLKEKWGNSSENT